MGRKLKVLVALILGILWYFCLEAGDYLIVGCLAGAFFYPVVISHLSELPLILFAFVLGIFLPWTYEQYTLKEDLEELPVIYVQKKGIAHVVSVKGRRIFVQTGFTEKPISFLPGELLSLSGKRTKLYKDRQGFIAYVEKGTLESKGKGNGRFQLEKVKDNWAKGYEELLGKEQGALVARLILGVDSPLLKEKNEGLKELGIIHILSISGFHVNLLEALLKRLKLKKVSGPIILAFALLVNNLPAWRAALMKLYGLLAKPLGRDAHGDQGLTFAALLTLVIEPLALFSLSFQLTYLATFGILCLPKYLGQVTEHIPFKKVKESLTLSLAALIPCVPILAFLTPWWNPVLFIANLLIVPLYSLICLFAFLLLPLALLNISFSYPIMSCLIQSLSGLASLLELILIRLFPIHFLWQGWSILYYWLAFLFILRKEGGYQRKWRLGLFSLVLLTEATLLAPGIWVNYKCRYGHGCTTVRCGLQTWQFTSDEKSTKVHPQAVFLEEPKVLGDLQLRKGRDGLVEVSGIKAPSPPKEGPYSDIMEADYFILGENYLRLR